MKATVNWYEKYANTPSLVIEGAEYPELSDFRFEQRGVLYYAELNGFVNYFAYESPGRGYGGRHFHITMKDGEERTLIGPWSSRAGCMNQADFGLCVDATLVGRWRIAGAVTLGLAVELCKEAGIELRCYDHHGEAVWSPWREDMDWKFKGMTRIC
jgi:hypothetical protein